MTVQNFQISNCGYNTTALSLEYTLTETDGSVYRIVREPVANFRSPLNIRKRHFTVEDIASWQERYERGIHALTPNERIRNVKIQKMMNGTATPAKKCLQYTPQKPIDNTLQATLQQLEISQQAEAALQSQLAINAQKIAETEQQATDFQKQAVNAQQNLERTQKEAEIAKQEADALRQKLDDTLKHLTLSNEEIAKLTEQNKVLYSIVQEKNKELAILLADNNANKEIIETIKIQNTTLMNLIRQI